ncbi:MFS transporter [Paenibacillus sp. p3-SID867]|uniref:MFS transporter n=1 Tax=Paenibacillus sp. p3-SID867 TaxID=2916363 RepID=UPI0021A598AA|nr:MFS transporter [Paenibacillus sp. p3-SID867]MCT1403708.1 MFS transporter [Paenibacillus sp. p3-SID867]
MEKIENRTTGEQKRTGEAAAIEAPAKAGVREWLGLGVLALPTLLMSMDISVLYLALPHLAADLAPSSTQMLWMVDIYGFTLAGFLIIMGKLADRIGRRKLLMIGAVTFGVASVLVAYSNSAEMLIATRALLGIAGATLMPSTLSLLRNMFLDPQQRSSAIGVWMMCLVAGSVLGPVVGGLMLEWFWWGSVFLLGVPVMLLLLITAPSLLPEYRGPTSERLDMFSAIMSLAAILCVVYGIKSMAKEGLDVVSILIIAAGLLIGWGFVYRQNYVKEPLVDIRLFRLPVFSGALCMMLLGLLTISGLNFYIAQYLQLVQHLSPFMAGLWLIPSAVGIIIGSVAAPWFVRRFPPAYVIGVGLLIACIGLVAITQLEAASALSVLIVGSVVFSIGVAPLTVLGTDLIIGAAPPEKAGSASAISETSAELGAALGITIMGSIATAVYDRQISSSLPEELPVSAAQAVKDSLPSAVEASAALPAELAAEVVGLAREAFTAGLNTIAATSAVLALLVAGLTVFLLRNVSARTE